MRAKRGFKASRFISLLLVVMFIIPAGNALATGAAGESEILIAEESASSLDVADHIVINEVCYNTTRGYWFEIYNPTDEAVNASNMLIWFYSINGPVKMPGTIINPYEYVVVSWNKTRVVKYWDIPATVKVIEIDGWGFPWDSIIISRSSGGGYDYDACGQPNVIKLPHIPLEHSWARYRGGYDTDNFTNDFYDEPNPTPGYENHRAKDDSSLSSPAWSESSLMLAMSVTVLVSAAILVVIFRRIRREG